MDNYKKKMLNRKTKAKAKEKKKSTTFYLIEINYYF